MEVLEDITRATPAGTPLFPYSLAQYRKVLKDTEGSLGLSMGWGPHSPRAGWASDSKAQRLSFEEVRERGRWISDGSLCIYLDVVRAIHILTQTNIKGFAQQLCWLKRGWRQYFPYFIWGAKHLPGHGPQGLRQGQCARSVCRPKPSGLVEVWGFRQGRPDMGLCLPTLPVGKG